MSVDLESVERRLSEVAPWVTRDGGLLAAFFDGPDGSEGHFRVDGPEVHFRADGVAGWQIWSTIDDVLDRPPLQLSVEITTAELAVVAVERFRRHRYEYAQHFGGQVVNPPVPLEAFMIDLHRWAEQLVAIALGGALEPPLSPGYDLVSPNEGRVQVKCSKRNKTSRLISTLTFKTTPSYFNHDHLVYVVFDDERFPVGGWLISSEALRAVVPDDRKSHQVEKILISSGADLTQALQSAVLRESDLGGR